MISKKLLALGAFSWICMLLTLCSSPGTIWLLESVAVAADEKKDVDGKDEAKQIPLASFVTLEGVLNSQEFRKIRNAALKLQDQATNEDRKAFLILEFKPGSSSFFDVLEIADFLVSAEVNRITPIAWIPESVTGNNVIATLACKEIAMHPDASLGDIGLGKAVKNDYQQSILSLVEKRRNPKVPPALVKGMMDPAVQVKIVSVEKPGGGRERKVVTPFEAEKLIKQRFKITDETTFKEAGTAGEYTATKSRTQSVLVSQLAKTRAEIVDKWSLPAESMRENKNADEVPDVRLIRIDAVIEPGLEAFLERQINRAVASGANMIIFEIDSPGGYVSTTLSLSKAIMNLKDSDVRSVAYIPEQAYSGAAIIALSCDEIYLHEDAHIGDAGMIEVGKGGQFEFAPEKILSPFLDRVESIVKEKGRPAGLAAAMIQKELKVFKVTNKESGRVWYMTQNELDNSKEEWIKGAVVPESANNKLLTMQGSRAVETKLATAVVNDKADLKVWLNIAPEEKLVAAKRTWVDSLVFTLSNPIITGFLFFLAILLIYIELHFMVGIFGIGSVLCFSLFFWSRFLGGTAGWLEVILFLLGMGCILMEVFVIPGFGVFGLSGGLLIIGSLVLASHSLAELNTSRLVEEMTPTLGTLLASIVSVIVVGIFLGRFMPQIPILKHAILVPPSTRAATHHEYDPKIRPDLKAELGDDSLAHLIGAEGTAMTMLRPSGKGRFEDEFLDVVSEGGYISEGATIKILELRGNQIVVREV